MCLDCKQYLENTLSFLFVFSGIIYFHFSKTLHFRIPIMSYIYTNLTTIM